MVSRVPGERPPDVTASRPRVSVIVPFVGSHAELKQLLEDLQALERRPEDELIVVDNRRSETPSPGRAGDVRIHKAGEIPTPGFARNQGARWATGEWLVFLDGDTRP